MIKFVHIGMRKCGSTTLQDFFANNPEIYYLGKLRNAGVFIDEAVGWICENLITRTPEINYDSDYVRSVIQKHIGLAEEKGQNVIGVSDEAIVGPGPQTTHPEVALRRVKDAFGEDVKIIYTIRNQWNFLKSEYGILVRHGYTGTYSEFVSFVLLQEHNAHFQYLLYDKVVKYLQSNFENVLIVPIERFWKEDEERRRMSDYIGTTVVPSVKHLNKGNTPGELEALRQVNMQHGYLLSDSVFSLFGCEWAPMNRNLKQFPFDKKFATWFDNHYFKGQRTISHEIAHKIAHMMKAQPLIAPEDITKCMDSRFGEANQRLAQDYNIDLQGLGYSGVE